jgi:hypothetical protein
MYTTPNPSFSAPRLKPHRTFISPPSRPKRRAARRAVSLLAREQARLCAHFREVLAELRARDVSHLPPLARANRERLIEELARYARTGRFPRNTDFPGRRVPYFVDASGTRCAMAHMIESTGETALVARVAGAMNNALVREMEGDLALQAWLAEAGLTAAEAGRIQPSYCFLSRAEDCLCGSIYSTAGVVEATVTGAGTDGTVTATVDAVHGDVAGTMVGQEVTTYSDAMAGDLLLIGVSTPGDTMPSYGPAVPFNSDGTVRLACGMSSSNEAPVLKKEDAIAGMTAGDTEACVAALTAADGGWGESICDDPPADEEGGGCSAAGPYAGSPLIVGTALAFAAVWSRRQARSWRRQRPSPR